MDDPTRLPDDPERAAPNEEEIEQVPRADSSHDDESENETMRQNTAEIQGPDAASRGPRLAYSSSRHRRDLREADDREVLGALRGGDEAALDELIRRKTEPLIQVVYRVLGDVEEARDVVQVAFLKVWENRESYDPRWSPNTWIYRIASNLAIDHLRSRKSRERHNEPYRVHLQDRSDTQSRRRRSELHAEEVMRIFHRLAEELTEKQRSVFLLREIEGLPSAEVAEIVGCRESTVRNHLFNARKILRRELLARYPEYARGYVAEEDA